MFVQSEISPYLLNILPQITKTLAFIARQKLALCAKQCNDWLSRRILQIDWQQFTLTVHYDEVILSAGRKHKIDHSQFILYDCVTVWLDLQWRRDWWAATWRLDWTAVVYWDVRLRLLLTGKLKQFTLRVTNHMSGRKRYAKYKLATRRLNKTTWGNG